MKVGDPEQGSVHEKVNDEMDKRGGTSQNDVIPETH